MAELKTCPFCGNKVNLTKHKFTDFGGEKERTYWQVRHRCIFNNYVETKHCGTKTEAARFWNRRSDERITELRRQLADVTVSMGCVEEQCAKLRELMREIWRSCPVSEDDCAKCPHHIEESDEVWCDIPILMCELGVEVSE